MQSPPSMIYPLESRDRSLGVHSPSFRTQTAGPELELVRDFIGRRLPPAPRGQRRSIFLEPRLESGFPDVVVVYWHPVTATIWPAARADLSKQELKLLHFLSSSGPISDGRMGELFGPKIAASLEKLLTAELLIRNARTWRARSLRCTYAVRRLIAIEAKMEEWRAGLRQAAQNVWFASESYLLLPSLPRAPELLEAADRFGVGIVTRDEALPRATRPAPRQSVPRSYASWLFNEWVWRAEIMAQNSIRSRE